jgi:hypothetical protein
VLSQAICLRWQTGEADVFERIRYQAGRIMSAARLGYAAYREEYYSADSALFDTYEARVARYQLNTIYFENKQYSALSRLRYSWRFAGRYRKMRAIYNFISRLVDMEVNKTYGGRIDWAGNLQTGAIPIILHKSAKPIVIDGLVRILEWSNFGDGKDVYVRNGATLGDSFLKAVTIKEGDESLSKVYIEVIDPHKVKDFELDERGNVKRIVIEYTVAEDDGSSWVYREEIDKKWFRFFRSDELYDEYENDYGFVPVTHTPHKHMVGGKKCGVTSFHNSLNKLDELNDGASVAKDGQRKANNPMLRVSGKLGNINTELRERDEMLVFEGGDENTKIETITPQTDTAGAIAIMEREDNEIQSDNPALSLQNMRKQGGELSGIAIENYYSDASDSLEAIQARYDERLMRILQMALTIAGMGGLEGFPFTLDSYARGEMRFYIKERKVFSAGVPLLDRLRLIMEAAENPAWEIIARQLELSDEDIEMVAALRAEREANAVAAAVRGLAQGVGMDEDEGDEAADIPEIEGDDGTTTETP